MVRSNCLSKTLANLMDFELHRLTLPPLEA